MCGFVRDLLPMLCEAKVDGLDSLTNPPIGNTTLADYWNLLGDQAILKSGISPIVLLHGTQKEVREHTHDLLQQADGRHLLIATADEVPFGTPRSNLLAVTEEIWARSGAGH